MSDCSTHAFDVPLKPCPFCGGEAVLHPTYDMDTNEVDGWFAWCDNNTCECKPETGQFFTEAEAVAAWNSRAERTCRNISGVPLKFKCSECDEVSSKPNVDEYNYCPNCGARVEVGE